MVVVAVSKMVCRVRVGVQCRRIGLRKCVDSEERERREMFVSVGTDEWMQYRRLSSTASFGSHLQMSNIASKHWWKMDADESLSEYLM